MEFKVNELGQPVVYIVNYVETENNVRTASFQTVTATFEEAERIVGERAGFEILEQDMMTREQCPMTLIQKQQVEKDLLVSLYKSGFKREKFEALEVRKPFQQQLNFPIAPELAKAEKAKTTGISI